MCKGLSVSEKEAKLKQKGIQVRKPKPKNWWIQQTNEKKRRQIDMNSYMQMKHNYWLNKCFKTSAAGCYIIHVRSGIWVFIAQNASVANFRNKISCKATFETLYFENFEWWRCFISLVEEL